MEGEPACPTGAKGGKRNERVCSREERKRRKTSGVTVEEVHASQQRQSSSTSSVSHGSHPLKRSVLTEAGGKNVKWN